MTIPTEELTHDDLELIEFARAIIDVNTDSEDGVHTMGAAVRGVGGKMFGGVNLFHFTGGPCAELVALGHARASGARELSKIVAVGNMGRGPVGPCGRDRQVLFDYHPKIRVILPMSDGVRSVAIRDLMPLGAVWTVEDGTQDFDPKIVEDGTASA
jgi:cytidine deaminase